jgi:hypothetical protein
LPLKIARLSEVETLSELYSKTQSAHGGKLFTEILAVYSHEKPLMGAIRINNLCRVVLVVVVVVVAVAVVN